MYQNIHYEKKMTLQSINNFFFKQYRDSANLIRMIEYCLHGPDDDPNFNMLMDIKLCLSHQKITAESALYDLAELIPEEQDCDK